MCRTQFVLGLVVLYVALVNSWDIVVVRSNTLEFYSEGILKQTATPASNHIKWITYDPVHDRVLFTEKYNREDSVSSFDITNRTTQSLIKRKSNRYITRFAYDPATELLFGTVSRSIYSFPLVSGNIEVDGDLVIILETIPQEVAVDSCGGYIYWTTNNIIERALFKGSEREVIIDKTDNVTLRHGLTVDSEKIYWIDIQEYNDGAFSIESADLDGNNRRTLYSETESHSSPDSLTISKDFISWGDSIEKFYWQLPKNANGTNVKPNKIALAAISSSGSQDIAANYKIEERTQGVPNCNALKSLLPDYQFCFNSSVFCVHGTKVFGKSHCDCTQGYIGERCDVSVCEDYCAQGSCNVSAEGKPTCRCNAGYTGERCDVSVCENYCFKGDCNVSDEGQPQCRCNAGYSGVRCDVNACHKHCLNNAICSLNKEDEPVCQCIGQYEGERCDFPIPKPERFHWLPLVDGKLPPGAIIGGFESEHVYIARANHSGSLCPGKYIRESNTAYFPWFGKEYVERNIEILCGFINAKWVKTSYNNIPKNALIGGSEANGEPLYICRGKIKSHLVCGKAHAPTKRCYLPYYGKERPIVSYEILVEE